MQIYTPLECNCWAGAVRGEGRWLSRNNSLLIPGHCSALEQLFLNKQGLPKAQPFPLFKWGLAALPFAWIAIEWELRHYPEWTHCFISSKWRCERPVDAWTVCLCFVLFSQSSSLVASHEVTGCSDFCPCAQRLKVSHFDIPFRCESWMEIIVCGKTVPLKCTFSGT